MDGPNSAHRVGSNDRSAGVEPRLTRRQTLSGTGAALVGALAGCGTFRDDGPPDDQEYERLQVTALYIEDGVDLSVPDEVQTVTASHNADLILLTDDTSIDADQAVDWLAEDRVLGILGDGAEATWLTWARSDTFRETFRGDGAGDSEPDPYLVVATAIGLDATTYRHSWSGRPRDRDLLRALDEVLVDIESRTPQ